MMFKVSALGGDLQRTNDNLQSTRARNASVAMPRLVVGDSYCEKVDLRLVVMSDARPLA
jgi:hypothetical protein